jgi:Methyltransferase small domain
LPSLPSEEVQIQFTAQSGRSNRLEAFEFYKVALSYIKGVKEPRIVDFGCGWGPVARFFLRETAPANLYLADVMDEAIRHLCATDNPCRIIRNQKKPPIEGVPEGIDVVFYAFGSIISWMSWGRADA